MSSKPRRWVGWTVAVAVVLLLAVAVPGDEPTAVAHPSGGRELCAKCHNDLPEVLDGSVVHAPVDADSCTACHNPHTARHGMLLSEEGAGLCNECHDPVAAGADQLPHLALADERQCLVCHASHAAEHEALLVQEKAALCGECHETVSAHLALPNVHAPVELGMCGECHAPHAGDRGGLLTADPPALCSSCHELDANLQQGHSGFELAGADCLSCHNPHASTQPHLLRPRLHAPYESGDCDTCHAAIGGDPGELVAEQIELCAVCHDGYEHDGELRHPLGAEVRCADCHSPHAGEAPGMLRREEARVCLDCHVDLEKRVLHAVSRHPNRLETGRCVACHSPHAAVDASLLRGERTEFCQGCHEDHSRFSHPIGSNVVDPRDPERTLECLSCHDAHASDHKMTLQGSPDRELCVACHADLHGVGG